MRPTISKIQAVEKLFLGNKNQAQEEIAKEVLSSIGEDHLKTLEAKVTAVRRISTALYMPLIGYSRGLACVGSKEANTLERIGSAVKADLMVFYHMQDKHLEEYLVVEYEGGEYAVRNANANSNGANLREIAKLVNGGYYEENERFESLFKDGEYAALQFNGDGHVEVYVGEKYPHWPWIVAKVNERRYAQLLEEGSKYLDAIGRSYPVELDVAYQIAHAFWEEGGSSYELFDFFCELMYNAWMDDKVIDTDISMQEVAYKIHKLAAESKFPQSIDLYDIADLFK